MQPYTKTNWVNDETLLSANNMNKIENQLETLTTNAINEAEDMGDLEDLDTTDKTSLVNAINEVAGNSGIKILTENPVVLSDLETGVYILHNISQIKYKSTSSTVYNTGAGTSDVILNVIRYNNYKYGFYYDRQSNLIYLDSNNTSWSSTALKNFVYTYEVITKTNTTSYTPTQQYHPATKGYVDTAIANEIGNINTVLATLTTPSNNGGGA